MFLFTLHVLSKLKDVDNKLLRITKKRIKETIRKGLVVEVEKSVTTSVGELDKSHSLCVVYRREGKNIIIITFFATKKGRYERKILS